MFFICSTIKLIIKIAMSADYEKLYNDLKEEYEQNKLDTDEIMKEYESTIKMLTDSAEKFKYEKEQLEIQLADSTKKMKQLQTDLENYKNKNIDKMKDIEILTTKNEKLNQEIQKINQNKSIIDSKIVTLENDNDHYLGKIRENEARIEDLNMKLESALEENISLQTDFETYKQMSEEQMIRKEQELKDANNEIMNKDKIINRLNRRDSAIMKQTAQKIITENQQRKMSVPININTAFNQMNNNSPANASNFRRRSKSFKTWSPAELNNIITPVADVNKKLPDKFVEMYSKSCLGEENKEKQIDEAVDAESDSSESEKKEFDVIEIEKGEEFEFICKTTIKDIKKMSSKQLTENLKEMLSRIQKRKSELLSYRKSINEKLEKIGVKIR